MPRAVERLHVTTGAGGQCHLNAGRAGTLGHSDPAGRGASSRLTQSDGDFDTFADAYIHADASTRSGPARSAASHA